MVSGRARRPLGRRAGRRSRAVGRVGGVARRASRRQSLRRRGALVHAPPRGRERDGARLLRRRRRLQGPLLAPVARHVALRDAEQPARAGRQVRLVHRRAALGGQSRAGPGLRRRSTSRYADGTPYHQFGTTCYAWTHQPGELQEQTLKTLAASPFNKIRFCVFPKSYYIANKNEPERFAFRRRPTASSTSTGRTPSSGGSSSGASSTSRSSASRRTSSSGTPTTAGASRR